jgi:virulence-associated protein VapD
MPRYTYKAIKPIIEETYMFHTKTSVYEALGNVDFDNVRVVVTAKDLDEAEAIRKGVTDIRMWELESEESL